MPDSAHLHDDACRRGVSGYVDPRSGLYVMTSAYLRNRGFCCGNACRHCPYVGTPGEHPDRATAADRRAPGSSGGKR